jgi:hypothetical protein
MLLKKGHHSNAKREWFQDEKPTHDKLHGNPAHTCHENQTCKSRGMDQCGVGRTYDNKDNHGYEKDQFDACPESMDRTVETPIAIKEIVIHR